MAFSKIGIPYSGAILAWMDTRETLVAAALKVLEQDGEAQFSTRAVCAIANVTQARLPPAREARHDGGMPWEEPTAVQLRVALLEIEPAIWRQLVVPWGFHLGQLHRVIQAAFGWWDCHLHEYMIGGLRYGDPEQLGEPEFEGDARAFDETAVRLCDFGRAPNQAFIYVYDFGDNWQHHVALERLIAVDPAPRTASCIAGARARPPEDVGSTSGYANFLEIIADPAHPEHRGTLTWCGGRFDPEAFDLDRTNRDVAAALRANRRIRRRQ